MIYVINNIKINVSIGYSEHKKCNFVIGSLHSTLESGGSSHAKEIKQAMKHYTKENNIELSENISHSIYGIYSAYILNK